VQEDSRLVSVVHLATTEAGGFVPQPSNMGKLECQGEKHQNRLRYLGLSRNFHAVSRRRRLSARGLMGSFTHLVVVNLNVVAALGRDDACPPPKEQKGSKGVGCFGRSGALLGIKSSVLFGTSYHAIWCP